MHGCWLANSNNQRDTRTSGISREIRACHGTKPPLLKPSNDTHAEPPPALPKEFWFFWSEWKHAWPWTTLCKTCPISQKSPKATFVAGDLCGCSSEFGLLSIQSVLLPYLRGGSAHKLFSRRWSLRRAECLKCHGRKGTATSKAVKTVMGVEAPSTSDYQVAAKRQSKNRQNFWKTLFYKVWRLSAPFGSKMELTWNLDVVFLRFVPQNCTILADSQNHSCAREARGHLCHSPCTSAGDGT